MTYSGRISSQDTLTFPFSEHINVQISGTALGVQISKRIVPPKITITKTDKKTETCERHVRQLLVRGEHVVCIIILPKEQQEEKQS